MLLTARDAKRVLRQVRVRLGRARVFLNQSYKKSQTTRPTARTFVDLNALLQSMAGELQKVADIVDDIV